MNFFGGVLSEKQNHASDSQARNSAQAAVRHQHRPVDSRRAGGRRSDGFGLWKKVRQIPSLDARPDKKRGYGPEVIIGQLIYALCTGGGCLSDSEALNGDPLALELFGVGKFADQSQVGEWLREQSQESVAALRKLLHEFVSWVWSQADSRRLLHAGQREIFFDDTQLEVSGKHFEGAAVNYNGDRALSWQTLWVGPLLADSHVGSPGDVSDQLVPMLQRNRSLWQGEPAHFYADSGSSAGVYLNAIAAEGWHYTISYNKWTGPLERTAQALPAGAWRQNGEAYHSFVRHQPERCAQAHVFAVSRQRDGLFDRYGFIACDEGQKDALAVGERHHLKGEKEQLFSEVLNGSASAALFLAASQPGLLSDRGPGLQFDDRHQTLGPLR